MTRPAASPSPALYRIEDIRIRRELPDTLLIDVEECGTPLAVVQDGSAWLVSPQGKIVEQLAAAAAGTTRHRRL